MKRSVLFFLGFFISSPIFAQSNTQALSYYGSGYTLFRLPTSYGVNSGTDTVRQIIAYSERFTCPFPTTYLDSVIVTMDVASINPEEGIGIAAIPSYYSSGAEYANVIATPYAENLLDSSDVTPYLNEPESYLLSMAHSQIADTDFFLTVVLPDTAKTVAYLIADSVTSQTKLPFDGKRDRTLFLLDSAYGNPGFYQNYLYGIEFDSTGPYYYPNFVMIALVSTPSGSVAELYPADEDPLTLYVERTAAGETILNFTPVQTGAARIDLYDATGRIVSTLFDGEASPNPYAVNLPTHGLANGMYFAKLSTATATEMRRIIVAN